MLGDDRVVHPQQRIASVEDDGAHEVIIMMPPMGLASLLLATPAWADHGGPLRTQEMSPLMIGLLAGLLALAAGVLIVVIVMLLTRKAR
jgi:hypothetical protein